MSSNRIKDQMQLASMHRRQFGRLAVGVLAVGVLAACGGGGGNEDEAISLRAAYDQINRGMTKDAVYGIVGREPYHKGDDNWVYRDGDETLMVHYGSYQGLQGILVTGIDWWTGGSGAQGSLTK